MSLTDLKINIEIADLVVHMYEEVSKAYKTIPFPASIVAAAAITKQHELTLPFKIFKIKEKYRKNDNSNNN